MIAPLNFVSRGPIMLRNPTSKRMVDARKAKPVLRRTLGRMGVHNAIIPGCANKDHNSLTVYRTRRSL